MALPEVVKTDGRNYTSKQQAFLDALYTNSTGDITQAMVSAGYTEGAGSTAIVKALKNEILEIANLILTRNAPRAANKLVNIMESDAPIPQANQKLNAAQSLLDRVGIVKENKLQVDHNVTGGIFVMPAKEELTIDAEDAEVINE
jgi:glycerate-2-kinase